MNTQLKTLVIPDYIESVDELFTDAKNVAFLGMDTSIIEALQERAHFNTQYVRCHRPLQVRNTRESVAQP